MGSKTFFCVFSIVFCVLLKFCQVNAKTSFDPEVIEGTVGVLYEGYVSSDRETIYQFSNVSQYLHGNKTALRVHTSSWGATWEEPITVVVRQGKGVLYWQIPMTFRTTSSFIDTYTSINRTLCPQSKYSTESNLIGAKDSDSSLFITVSTSRLHNISFHLMVFEQTDFVIEFDQTYTATASPSAPIYYQLEMPEDVDVGILILKSEDNPCMTLSIQNVSCPVHDLGNNVEFDSVYQSVHRQAGITFSRSDFPLGFFVVLIVRPDDDLCIGMNSNASDFIVPDDPFRHKEVKFSISRKITQEEYLIATFGAFLIFFSAYIGVFLISCISCVRRSRSNTAPASRDERRPLLVSVTDDVTFNDDSSSAIQIVADVHDGGGDGAGVAARPRPRRVNYGSVSDSSSNIRTDIEEVQGEDGEADIVQAEEVRVTYARSEDSSLDEMDIDLLEDANREKDIFRTKSRIYLSDLSRKSNRVLTKKANLYSWNLMTIATFYGLPVVQLVFTYQNVTNSTGNQDICYFNFLCAQKLGLVSDFNHIFSNLGYVMLGILFMVVAYARDLAYRQRVSLDPSRENFGIPQQFGMYYALGIGLIVEGVMSGCYHVCPNHTNFQFDTAFMYTISVLILLTIYQTRHPDINANAYTAFGVLAFIILVSTIGVLQGNLIFWIFFTSLHIVSCLVLSINIYYMGRWKLNAGIFKRMWLICYNDARAFCGGHWYALKPLYVDRMILLLVMNAANWGLSGYGVFVLGRTGDFASFLLAVFISNVMLYTMFYIVMKLRYRERIKLVPALYIILSTVTWIGAMVFFFNKSTTWKNTPALSRDYNQECKLFHFYDNHDIWHFLSAASLFFSFMIILTLDDDLVDVPREKIPVF